MHSIERKDGLENLGRFFFGESQQAHILFICSEDMEDKEIEDIENIICGAFYFRLRMRSENWVDDNLGYEPDLQRI